MGGRKMKNKILLLFLLFFSLLAFSCKTAEFGYKVININGMVYDFSNRPVAHYEVALGRKYKGVTDINGRFTLPKVPFGVYKISGNKIGYEDYHDEVIVKDKGQIIYIRIPSQNQLLNIVDDALTANNFTLAGEMAERALQIDKNNMETLFYNAAVSFRQRQFDKAVSFLEAALDLGSKDLYVEKFLSILRELQNESQAN
jgi:tetratricopeptide (TPR) repeat protein